MHAIYGIICKKRKKKPKRVKPELAKKLSLLKYGILLLIAICCFAGVYQKARGTSPWDVFSMLHAGNFRLASYLPGILLLILILIGMFLKNAFSAVFCARWELFFRCSRSCRFLPCTGNGKTVFAAAVPAPDSARLPLNCHRMDPWIFPEIVFSVKNVSIRARKEISTVG